MTPDQPQETVPQPLLESSDSPLGNFPSKIVFARFIGAGLLASILSMVAFAWGWKVTGNALDLILPTHPGSIFGIYLAAGLGALRMTGGWRLGIIFIASALGFWAAFIIAMYNYSLTLDSVKTMACGAGIPGGAAGTAILAAGIWLAAPRLRPNFPWRGFLRTGVLVGSLLIFFIWDGDVDGTPWLIFIWQSVMAVFIALVLLESPLPFLRDRMGALGREIVLWVDVVIAILVAILLTWTAIRYATVNAKSRNAPAASAPAATPAPASPATEDPGKAALDFLDRQRARSQKP